MNENAIREGLRRLGVKLPHQVLAADEPVICDTYPCAIIQNTGIPHLFFGREQESTDSFVFQV